MLREQDYVPFRSLHTRLKPEANGELDGEANAEVSSDLNGDLNAELYGDPSSESGSELSAEPRGAPSSELSVESRSELPEPALDGYKWFDQGNKEDAYAALQGSQSAADNGLDMQAEFYYKKAMAICVLDAGQGALIRAGLDFDRNKWRLLQHPSVPQNGFTVDVEAFIRDDGQYYKESWIFTDAASIGNKLIPPQAFQVLNSFRRHIVPDKIWLVEVREMIGAAQFTGDPILCVSIGQWIVPVTWWK
ncbi:MAG: hypothetical protein HYY30_07680 [Chloroflexi bacterium]|nr:hypothetical protein [Chloroflexota bacterium]